MRLRSWLAILALCACGRRGFDTDAGVDDAADAPADGAASCIRQLTAADAHVCALRTDGTIRCWGQGDSGQLGNGSFAPTSAPVQVVDSGGAPFGQVTQISGGIGCVTCARRADGTAWCWGAGEEGQLGNGAIQDRAVPQQVVMASGDPLDNVTSVVTGEFHTCAVRGDRTVWCWGRNLHGQLGMGSSGAPFLVAVPTMNLADVAGIALGLDMTYAWTYGGTLFSWGEGAANLLGDGTVADRSIPGALSIANVTGTSNANKHACAFDTAGAVRCWGLNSGGVLGDGTMNPSPTPVLAMQPSVVQLGVGDGHTCARTTAGAVFCWGSNGAGQLGEGIAVGMSSPLPLRVSLPGPALDLAVGNYHNCVLLADDIVMCWGTNVHAEMGDGVPSPTPHPQPVPVAGLCN